MKILLNENQFQKLLLHEFKTSLEKEESDYDPIADGNVGHNPYKKKLDRSMDAVASYLHNNGKIMTNIDNGKDYIVYEIASFGQLMGKRCVICQLIKDNEPYGSIYLKPHVLFKIKNF